MQPLHCCHWAVIFYLNNSYDLLYQYVSNRNIILWIDIIILNKYLLVRTDLLLCSINGVRIFLYCCFDFDRYYLIICRVFDVIIKLLISRIAHGAAVIGIYYFMYFYSIFSSNKLFNKFVDWCVNGLCVVTSFD